MTNAAVIDVHLGYDPETDGLLRTRDAAASIGLGPARFRDLASAIGLLPVARRQVYRHDRVVEEHLWAVEQVEAVGEEHRLRREQRAWRRRS